MSEMIAVDEALAQVLAGIMPLPAENAPLLAALGRVLARDLVAPDNIPPFRNAAMDGYAVRATDIAPASRHDPSRLVVIAAAPAGYAPTCSVAPGTAVRIMTGAPLPPGADTVIRFEDTDEQEGAAGAATREVAIYVPQASGTNVREAGEDVQQGTTILRAGDLLRPVEIGILAAAGYATAPAYRRPVVAVIATGDEVAEPGEPMRPGQIRNSNSYTLAALVQQSGGVPRLLGVARDDRAELSAILDAARDADLILSSGGVSVGDYDLVKDVLRAAGEIAIWQVRMKPGRPLAFGRLGGRPFLGLPGNPVAAFVSFEVFGRPLLRRMLGHTDVVTRTIQARVAAPVNNHGGRRHYLRAVVTSGDRGPEVVPTGEQGSGILTALARANGLLIVPDGVECLAPGDLAEVLPLHDQPHASSTDVTGTLAIERPGERATRPLAH